jgi:hypothetical protein
VQAALGEQALVEGDEEASPPPVNLGRNRIAKTATDTTAPSTSAPWTARMNLRAIASSSLSQGQQGHHRHRRCEQYGTTRCRLRDKYCCNLQRETSVS